MGATDVHPGRIPWVLRAVLLVALMVGTLQPAWANVARVGRVHSAMPSQRSTLGAAPRSLRLAVARTLGPDAGETAPGAQEAKLTAPDGLRGDAFAWSVALSKSTAIVGAPFKVFPGPHTYGAAYVFVRSKSGTWSYQAELTASDPAENDHFGYSVAFSGYTAVVGAPYRDVGPNQAAGAAYVFVRSKSGTWVQQTKLTAPGGAADDHFGYSVAMSKSTALIGAPEEISGDGAAYVFDRSDQGIWSLTTTLVASDPSPQSKFGWAVALSGSHAMVTSPTNDVVPAGAAYAFTRSKAGTWSQEDELTGSWGSFGLSVALSKTTAIVGSPVENSFEGAAYAYVHTKSGWALQATLTASDGAASDQFGYAVGFSGSTSVVGAPYHAATGSAYEFVRSRGTWFPGPELAPLDGVSGDRFGWSVAVSGMLTVVGTPWKDTTTGAAYVFSF
jgi:hypothetical protein